VKNARCMTIASCYLKEFNTLFVLELIKHVSEDTDPWQPTFGAVIVITKIRRQVYPNVTETFKGKDLLAALVSQYKLLHSHS